MMTENKTHMAASTRQAVEHVLNFLATERVSEIDFAISAIADAKALSQTKAENRFAIKLQKVIGDMKFTANVRSNR